jgi:hypothetical protein
MATIYLKSLLVGVLCAVAAIVCYVVGGTVGFLLLTARTTGSGGIGAVSTGLGGEVFLLALIAFAAGSYWEFRRASRVR